MKKIIPAIGLLLTSLQLQAQDTTQAIQHIETALNAPSTKAKISYFQKAIKSYQEMNAWDRVAQTGLQFGQVLLEDGTFQLAIEVLPEITVTLRQHKIESNEAADLNKTIGKAYYAINKYKKALTYLEQALEIRQKVDAENDKLAKDYTNLGIVARIANRNSKAIFYLKTALNFNPSEDIKFKIYSELGTNYELTGNLLQSLDYLNESIRFFDQKNEKNSFWGGALIAKGSALTNLQRFDESEKCLKKAISYFKASEDYLNLNIARNVLTENYQVQFVTIPGSPKEFINKAIQNALITQREEDKTIPKSSLIQFYNSITLGSCYLENNDFENSEIQLNKAIAFAEKHLPPNDSRVYALSTFRSKYSLAKGDLKQALAYIQKNIQIIIPSFSSQSILDLPTKEQILMLNNVELVLDPLAEMARMLVEYKSNLTEKRTYLEKALEATLAFDAALNELRKRLVNSGSSAAWSNLSYDAYEIGISACYQLFELTKDSRFIQQALFFSEKSKSLSLLEAFQNSNATRLAGLNPKEVRKEQDLRLDLTEVEQEIFQLEQNKLRKTEAYQQLKKEQFKLKKEHKELLAKLEQRNPDYFKVKYKLPIRNLKEIQAQLETNQAMLQYFHGDSALYIFTITPTDFRLNEVRNVGNLSNQVLNVRSGIYDYYLGESKKNKQLYAKYAHSYSKYAHKLYKTLIAPAGDLPERLIIVPSGALCNLPFEALLEKMPERPSKFKSHDYLIKKHSISYCYSATLLHEMQSRSYNANKTYLAFAPTFNSGTETALIRGTRYSLSPLAYNMPEVDAIQELLGTGDVYKGENATEDMFKSKANGYKIIHLATHGMANDENPDFSLLAFTQIEDSLENEFLYVKDLYNMPLNAELVVLSACETALGKYTRGEGITSLARGFSYAGAKSIFTTLWSVNDQATFNIVNDFYNNLKNGMPKDLALQKARIDFIESSNDQTASPFLWSPYILIGDSAAIELPQNQNKKLWVGIGALVLLAGGLFFRKKANQA